nr:hypothetical protein [Tanacetum cinerariifolium]
PSSSPHPWNYPIFFYDEDEEYTIQYREYLEKSPDAITTVLSNEEPEYSLSIGYEHPNTTSETESDERIKSGVEELVPIPRECEVISEDKKEFIEYVEASLSDPEIVIVEEENVVQQEEEEVDLEDISKIQDVVLRIENFGYDSEGDIRFLKELPIDDSNNESSDFEDDPLFPRPPLEPPDVEFFFNSKPEVISAVMNNIEELNEDECFDPGGEIDVSTNDEDDDYFPFMFVIRIFLLYLIYPEVFPLLLSAESEDTIFNPGISI